MSDKDYEVKTQLEPLKELANLTKSVKDTSYTPPKTVFPMKTEYNNYEIKGEDYNNHPNGSTIANTTGGRRRRRTRRHKSTRSRKSRKVRKSRRRR